MPSSINASTTAGLVNTADTSGVLQLQTAGTTAISIDASQAVSFTNAPTVTGGTANGVAYLNGSKVLTTGSALVFNGTNLGVGVTPSAFATVKAMQLNTASTLMAFTNEFDIGQNVYYNAGNKYITTGLASMYAQTTGQHQWFTAPSGTAGNAITFTQAMTLDASGNLLLAGTTARQRITVGTTTVSSTSTPEAIDLGGTYSSAAGQNLKIYTFNDGSTKHGIGVSTSSSDYVTPTGGRHTFYVNTSEVARIDSSGNLLVGTTSLIGSGYRAEFFREQDCIVSVDCGTPANDGQSMFMLRSTYSGSTRSAAMGFYRNASAAPNLYVNFKDIGNNDRFVWSDNTGVLRISASGSDLGTTGGTVVGTQTSDERLKTIEPTFPYGLETVNQLVPIKYTLDGELTPKLGFGAQTTQPVIPEVVYDSGECIDGYDENPDNMMRAIPKSDRTKLMIDNVQIIPVLVKAIQEQQALITQLQADVAALKGA